MSFCKDCIKGVTHEGTPEGTIETIGGIECYVATPTVDYPTDKAILFITDVFGIPLLNNQLLADDFAGNGFKNIVPDYLRGDAVPADALNHGGDFDLMKCLIPHGAAKCRAPLDAVLESDGVTSIGALACENIISAAATAHPGPSQVKVPADLEKYAAMSKAPLLLNTCTIDAQFPHEAQAKADEVFANFAPGYRREYFEGCTHGFAVRGDLSDAKVKAGKEGAFAATVEWFSRHV
ncbi:hypothetical protein C8R43DRAFT_1186696 [Mycena crocata]|nr:hypothetical protein C8R43DRAFT_1186696 [Mycena crocata]